MARLRDQKKSTNFINRVFERLVPTKPDPSFVPSWDAHGNGLNYLNKLFMDAVSADKGMGRIQEGVQRFNDWEQPAYMPNEPYWDPEFQEMIKRSKRKKK
jgi:hypothetical protein